jgi:SAM-dependent methyltransferase
MREFWDERAREDALFFVDTRRTYRSVEVDGFWEGGERDLDRLLTVAGARLRPSDVALDIGCGVGRLTRAIARRTAFVYAIDVSPEMIDLARSYNRDLDTVEWIVGDGVSLRPLRDSSVDVCLSHVVFQHIPDPEITLGYIAEIGRLLKPAGWAAFVVSADPRVHRRRRIGHTLRGRIGAALGRAPRGQADPAWLGSAVELDALRAVAAGSGLELDRVEGEGTQFCLVRARKR